MRYLPLLLLLLSSFAQGQEHPANPPVDQLRTVLAPGIELHLDLHDRLVIDHLDEHGLHRRDILALEALDLGLVSQDTLHHRITLACRPEFKHCIRTVYYRQDMVKNASRIELPTNGNGGSERSAISVFTELSSALED